MSGFSAVPLAALLLCAACDDPRVAQVKEDADQYIVGVQYEDARGLVKRMGAFRAAIADAPDERWEALREEHEALAVSSLADYEQAKESGSFPLKDDGIALLKGLAVGKGVYYTFKDIRHEAGGQVIATMLVELDYSAHRFEAFPTGTKVFLMQEPLGSLRVVTIGDPEPEPLMLVESIELEWRMRWYPAADVYPEVWAVESIRSVPGTIRVTAWSPA